MKNAELQVGGEIDPLRLVSLWIRYRIFKKKKIS